MQAKSGGDWTPGTDDLTADAESFEFQNISLLSRGMTKTSDQPMWNPVAKMNEETFSGASDVHTITLTQETHKIRLQKVSSGITVAMYFHGKWGEKVAVAGNGDDPDEFIVDGKVTTVVLDPSSAGSCQLVELRKECSI